MICHHCFGQWHKESENTFLNSAQLYQKLNAKSNLFKLCQGRLRCIQNLLKASAFQHEATQGTDTYYPRKKQWVKLYYFLIDCIFFFHLVFIYNHWLNSAMQLNLEKNDENIEPRICGEHRNSRIMPAGRVSDALLSSRRNGLLRWIHTSQRD